MSATMTPETGRPLSAVAEEGGRALKRALSSTAEERSRDLFLWLTDSHEGVPMRLKAALAVEGLVWAVTALTTRVSELEAERGGAGPTENAPALAALEQRISELEQKPFVKFRGVHDESRTYDAGDACVRSGSLWISQVNANGSVPGTSPAMWTLAVKRSNAQWHEVDARLKALEGRNR